MADFSVWTEDRDNKNGKVWVCQWKLKIRDPQTKKIIRVLRGYEHCGTSEQYATKRKFKLIEEFEAGKVPEKKILGLDLFTLRDQYLAERRGGDEITFSHWVKPAVESFCEWRENCLANQVTRDDIVAWRNYLLDEATTKKKKKGYGAWTVKGRVRDLCRMFSWALENGKITDHPVKGDVDNLMPKTVDVGRLLTFEEMEILLPELDEPLRKACYVVLHHGQRKEELRTLDWTRTYTHAIPWLMDIKPIKRGKKRTVEVAENVRRALGAPQASGHPVAGLTIHMLDHGIREAIARIKERTGRDLGRIRLHDFRHTAATYFMWRHGDVFRLMREFGWQSLRSAQVYQHETRRQNVPDFPPLAHYRPTIRVASPVGQVRIA